MKKIVTIIWAFFFYSEVQGQTFWQKLNETPYFLSQSMALDQKGNAYVSVHLHEGVYQFSIHEPTTHVFKMPKISPLRYDPQFAPPIHLFLDIDDNIYAIRDAIPYIYINEKFVLDSFTKPCNQNIPTAYFDSKMDENGQLFFSLGSLYKYHSKWCLDTLPIVLKQDSIGLVFKYFPYSAENNYAVTKTNDFNITNVYRYNSSDFSYVKLVESYFTINHKTSYVSPKGHIYLPSKNGLLHYWDDGQKYEIVLLDSSLGSRIPTMGAFGSKNNTSVIVKNISGFYFTTNDGLSWTKPEKINTNFPVGEIINLEFYDSTRVIATIKESCELAPRAFILQPFSTGWEVLNIGESFMEIDEIVKDKNTHLYAFINECQWAVSKDEGKNWEAIFLNNRPLKSFVLNDESKIFGFESGRDSTLYKSEDYGKSWKPIYTFKGRLLFIHNLKGNRLMAITDNDTTIFRIPVYYYYLSEDNGVSWKLQNAGIKPYAPIGSMVMRQNEEIIAYDRNTVMHSLDLGKTWLADPAFSRIKNMTRFYFDPDGMAILYGDLDGVKGIYTTSDFTNYDNISSGLPFELYRMEYFGSGKIAVFGSSLPTYIYYSSDYGKSWTDVFKDLPMDYRVRVPFITDFYMDEGNHLYLSNYYDGVYRTMNPVTTTRNIQKDQLISIYPNPASDQLTVSYKEEYSNFPIQIVIQNMFGQKILEMDLLNSNSNVNLNQVPAGIYVVAIYKKGRLQHRQILMKE